MNSIDEHGSKWVQNNILMITDEDLQEEIELN